MAEPSGLSDVGTPQDTYVHADADDDENCDVDDVDDADDADDVDDAYDAYDADADVHQSVLGGVPVLLGSLARR